MTLRDYYAAYVNHQKAIYLNYQNAVVASQTAQAMARRQAGVKTVDAYNTQLNLKKNSQATGMINNIAKAVAHLDIGGTLNAIFGGIFPNNPPKIDIPSQYAIIGPDNSDPAQEIFLGKYRHEGSRLIDAGDKNALTIWDTLVNFRSDTGGVFAYDNRGTGASTKISDAKTLYDATVDFNKWKSNLGGVKPNA